MREFMVINQIIISSTTEHTKSQDRDDILVKFVQQEDIIWRRNHPQFKNIVMKEQAWGRVACQLGISSESHTYTQSLNHFLLFPLLSSSSSSKPSLLLKLRINPIMNPYIRTWETTFACLLIEKVVCYTADTKENKIKGVRGSITVCE